MNLVTLKQNIPFGEFPAGMVLFYPGAGFHKQGFYVKINSTQIQALGSTEIVQAGTTITVQPVLCLSEHEYRLYSNILSIGQDLVLVMFLGKYYWTWGYSEGAFKNFEEAVESLITRGHIQFRGKQYKWYAPSGMFVQERDPYETASHATNVLVRHLKNILPEEKVAELTMPLASAIEEAKCRA
jgi:hypothetical protein